MSGPPRGPPPAGIARGPPPRGMPPGGPRPPGFRGPPGRGPPGMPPRGPGGMLPGRGPPGMMPRGPPGRGMPPGGPLGPPRGMVPGRGPPGMAPRGMPPGRGPPGMPPGRGPPGMPPRGMMPGRGPPGRGPPGRGPPGMPPRGMPRGMPPGMGPRGMPPGMGARGPPGRGIPPGGPFARPPRGPPMGMPPRGPPGMPGAPPGGAPGMKRFGKLTVQVVSGVNLRVPSMVGQADIYVKLRIGDQEFRTKVAEGGGANPRYGDTFLFNITNEKEIEIGAWTAEKVGDDKLIGDVTTSFMGWIGRGTFDGNVSLKDKLGKDAGAVGLSVKFQRPTDNAPPGGPPGGVPARAPGGPQGPPSAPGANEPPRDPNGKFTDREIKEAFQAFDLDHNNYIGAGEIKHVLLNIGERVTDEEVDEMIRMVDKDGDGQVSFDEFYEMVSGGKQPPSGLWEGPGGAAGPPEGMSGHTAPEAGVARPGATAASIQQRNQRKNALDDFAREFNIKPESIKKAYKRFQETDVDKSGLIDYAEFCEILQVDPSPQVEKLFQLFDKDRSGQIDIKEFMIGLSNFSGAGKEEKLKFAFMVFDEDGNGVITKQELIKILKANHMATSDKEVVRKAETIMMQADKDGDGVISFDEFVIVSKKFPNILFPAYSLGQKLTAKLGV